MKSLLLAAAMAVTIPLAAHAQIVIQAPPIPGVRVGEPNDYWRHRRDDQREDEWRRRAEFREEEHRRVEWRRAHCVRDYRGEEYCRR